MSYEEFIKSKALKFEASGFTPKDLHPSLFDYQKHCVTTALEKGRFALFLGTGLGKSLCQLEWARQVHSYTNRPVLVIAPLSVAKQTATTESTKWGIQVKYCESQVDVINGINITNYEKIEKFDCETFSGIVLDESSILKGFNGKTRTMLIELFQDTPYKLCCTATPSPNDYVELGNHCEFLNVMKRDEMLATFFVHDGKCTLADEVWKLKKHGKVKFWEWLADWSIMMQKPSDIGFSDDNYWLPELIEHEIKIESGFKREGELFTMEAKGVSEQRTAKKDTLEMRVQAVADIVNNSDFQWLVWCDLNAESEALKKAIPDAVEVKGSDKDKHKEQSALDFASGKIRVLISKPSIYGFGLNFQNCHNMIFVGLSNSFELTYQSVRRCYRFGQQENVNVYYVCVDVEGAVLKNIQKKHRKFTEMQSQISKHVMHTNKTHKRTAYEPTMNIQKTAIATVKDSIESIDYTQGKNFDLFQGDCCKALKGIADGSIDFSIFSPPFADLFTYSDSYSDMGNVANDDEFYKHYRFLATELFRVIKPGRLVSIHCEDLLATKTHDGFIGLKNFSGEIISIMKKAGFYFHSRVTIWKDPVVQMQRTKSIGLLHKQVMKDSSLSRQGLCDYLVTFRKPGVNVEPIEGTLEKYYGTNPPSSEFLILESIEDGVYNYAITDDFEKKKWHSVNIWQRYASPVWDDIAMNDTLNFREGKGDDDQKHICPLQLTVIRRALQLWTNPDDVVLSPFAGIGSEGYVSLDMGRKFVGVELKKSYYECAIKNLEYIENKPKQFDLFDAIAA